MASICVRNYVNGKESVRVVLRKKGYPTFSISFDDWKSACDWVKINEIKYYQNPLWYFEWRIDLFYKMKKEKKTALDHIIRPKSVPKNMLGV